MTYPNILTAKFIARPNRFIAKVEIKGASAIAHVKNTGRCRELLIPGATVYLSESDNPLRKTRYDLIAVQKGERLINMDSQAPNRVFFEHLQAGHFYLCEQIALKHSLFSIAYGHFLYIPKQFIICILLAYN
jgi:sugar fermentation stimulation protein A